jgi:hypothetical protein
MEDTFYSRISILTDSELQEYVHNCSKYKYEVVEAAMNELRKRGCTLSADELQKIQEAFSQRREILPYSFGIKPIYLKIVAIIVWVGGLCSSCIIYFYAQPVHLNPLGYDPLDTKTFLRNMEVYGGKANILIMEFRQWFAGFWQGETLAFSIAAITVFLGCLFWLLSFHKQTDFHADSGRKTSADQNKA